MGQLYQWIYKDEFQLILDEGYKIYLLEVLEYQEGRDQIIYTKQSIVTKVDISSLFV